MNGKRQAQVGDKVICTTSKYEHYNAYKDRIYEIESILDEGNCKIRDTMGYWGYPIEKSNVFRLYESKSDIFIKRTKVKRL